MTLLALDLGSACGWCLLRGGVRVASGTWNFATKPATKRRPARERFTEFASQLLACVQEHQVKAIGYDRVFYQPSAAVVFGGWVAVVSMVAHSEGCEVLECSSGEVTKIAGVKRLSSKAEPCKVKRRAATKAGLIAAAQARGWPVESDDEAEACFIGAVLSERLNAGAEVG